MTRSRTHAPPQQQKTGPRPVTRPHDRHEREADRAADVVARGGSVAGWSFSTLPVSAGAPVQRQQAEKPKSEDEKYKEALKKAGEAALATKEGQALKEKVLADPLVKPVVDAVTSTPGLVATGAALAGGVVALGAAGKELPVQPPEIPLEKVSPKLAGISAKITYEGPVNAPTSFGLTITVKEQAPKGTGAKKPDPIAADTARLKAQEEMFRKGRTYAPGSKEAEDERLLDQAVQNYVLSRSTLPGFTIPLTPPAATKKEEQKPAQPAPASPSAATPAQAHVDGALATAGRPLDPATRRSMEARFGYDFSGVRVHDDARAAATAASIDAAAFTVGEDVVFGAGRHDPSSPGGRRLLAHELAHVVQQSRPRGRGGPVSPGRPLDERQRAYFEPRLGADFRHVRIHADEDAAASATARRARAYTTGSDVVFGPGQYSPDTPRGRWLLAHELAHVTQAGRPAGVAGTPAVEKDASAAATDALHGRRARIGARRRSSEVHLFGEPDNVPDLTFVSQSGTPGFLNQAVQFHQTWGLAPARFSSMQQLLATLAADTGAIPRLRIVSHANFDNLFTPLFDGGSAGITEEDLLAFGESDVAGLRRTLGGHVVSAATATQVLDAARQANAAALQPFGLDQPGSTATGAVDQLVLSSIDLLVVRTAAGIPQNQRTTLEDALTAEIAGLRTQVQAAAPAGAGVTAAQAQALENALTGVTGFTFTLPPRPGPFIAAVQTATTALTQGFRTNLDAVRARLSSSSWIDIRGCRVGQRPTYLAAVARFFGTATARPNVSGPDWFQSYPTLGAQTVQDAGIRARARDRDVQAALAHWAEVTGIRSRLMWWLRFLSSVLREEAERAAAPPGALTPPSLSGGLTLQLDPFLLPPLEGPLPPLRPLQGPTLLRPQPSALGGAVLRNPFVEVARREIPRYTAPDGELRYYLEAGLPLPVQRARDVQDIFLLIRVGSERGALDAWLNSQWEPAAPGLAALQAGNWARDELRQVEAVSDLDAARRAIALFVSPDPRYAEHIKTT